MIDWPLFLLPVNVKSAIVKLLMAAHVLPFNIASKKPSASHIRCFLFSSFVAPRKMTGIFEGNGNNRKCNNEMVLFNAFKAVFLVEEWNKSKKFHALKSETMMFFFGNNTHKTISVTNQNTRIS